MTSQRFFSPPVLAKLLGVSADHVLSLIHAGELKASNVTLPGAKRPRYKVAEADVEAFLARRASTPPEPTTRRRAKRETLPQFV